MPWKETTNMSQRTEFITQAKGEGVNFSALCRLFGISRKTGYKWLKREAGAAGLADQSRRPQHSPRRTAEIIEGQVLEVRKQHEAWGGRKIRKVLQNQGNKQVPAGPTFATPQWRELFKHAVQQADRLGLESVSYTHLTLPTILLV